MPVDWKKYPKNCQVDPKNKMSNRTKYISCKTGKGLSVKNGAGFYVSGA